MPGVGVGFGGLEQERPVFDLFGEDSCCGGGGVSAGKEGFGDGGRF